MRDEAEDHHESADENVNFLAIGTGFGREAKREDGGAAEKGDGDDDRPGDAGGKDFPENRVEFVQARPPDDNERRLFTTETRRHGAFFEMFFLRASVSPW